MREVKQQNHQLGLYHAWIEYDQHNISMIACGHCWTNYCLILLSQVTTSISDFQAHHNTINTLLLQLITIRQILNFITRHALANVHIWKRISWILKSMRRLPMSKDQKPSYCVKSFGQTLPTFRKEGHSVSLCLPGTQQGPAWMNRWNV